MDSSNKNHNKLNPAVIPFIGTASICALNFFFNISPISIISYIIASGLYFLYSVFSSVDNSIDSDYMQSGEGSFSLLFFLIGFRFLTDNIFILFPITVFMILVIIIFIQKVYSSDAGFIINPLSILITCYLFYFDKLFSIKFIKKLLTGLAEKNYETLALFSTIFIISLIFIYKFRSTGIIFSHGKKFSCSFSKSETILQYLFLFLKSLIIVSALYLSGVAGFAAYYIYRFYYRGKINIGMIFYFIFFYLSVLFSLKFIDPLIVSSAVLILSVISHIIYKINKVDIYDRSIRYKL